MGANSSIFINGLDLTSIGAVIQKPTGLHQGLGTQDVTIPIQGVAGLLLPGMPAKVLQRDIMLSGWVRASTNALLLANIDKMKYVFSLGTLELTSIDLPGRVLNVRKTTMSFTMPDPAYLAREAAFEVRLTAFDPYWYDQSPQEVYFGSAPSLIPLGSAPSVGDIRIACVVAFSNHTVTYRNSGGDAVGTMGFTLTMAAGDEHLISLGRKKIYKYTAATGVTTTIDESLTTGDFFILDPQDADFINGTMPTIETTGGTGVLQYKRSYE